MSILNNEVTTLRQIKNGTRAFHCLRTNSIYTSHSNGYVRRQVNAYTKQRQQYQLNPKKSIKRSYSVNGTTQSYNTTTRIMVMNESDRLDIIERLAEKYQGYRGNSRYYSQNLT